MTKKTIHRVDETKNWVFEKINKKDQVLVNQNKRKAQINSVRDRGGLQLTY